MRRKPPGKLLKSAHAVDREFKVLTALMPTEVPTPNTFHLCEDIGIIGTAFYIMEYCDGVIYWDPIASELHKDRRHHIFDEMNKGIDTHTRFLKLGLGDFESQELYLKTNLKVDKAISRLRDRKFESMHKLIEYCQKNPQIVI